MGPFGFDIRSSNQNILHEDDDLNVMGTTGTFHSVGSEGKRIEHSLAHAQTLQSEGGITSPAIHWPKGLDVPAAPSKRHI